LQISFIEDKCSKSFSIVKYGAEVQYPVSGISILTVSEKQTADWRWRWHVPLYCQ